jgi:hypothetical protein
MTNRLLPRKEILIHPQHTCSLGADGDDEEVLRWFAKATWKTAETDKEDWARHGKQWK